MQSMQSPEDRVPRQDDGADPARQIRFGAFRYFPDQSILLKGGKRVRIGSRALCLLKALTVQIGRFVPNDELFTAAWPDTHVDDTNIRVQITALRRVLCGKGGAVRITNAPGRGYALTVAPDALEDGAGTATPPGTQPDVQALPRHLTSLVGRAEAVDAVIARLSGHRFVTIAGPGGIGKTRVAIEACARLDADGQRICFVDFSPLSSGAVVASTIAGALLIDDDAIATSTERIVRALADQPYLLVLDNCEHVLDAATVISEDLLRAVPDLRILATSREPLLVEGEVVVRLAGLGRPSEADLPRTLSEALGYPAIQLLLERAEAAVDSLKVGDADVSAIVEICHRLDGIPLAIELAAASIAALGIGGVAALIRDQFPVLSSGRRTAPPRQRTMRATLEWSYEKLTADEQSLLVRLSVFRAMFSASGAQAVNGLSPQVTLQLLSSLVAKSLVFVDHRFADVRFRLLETTRAFVEEKLEASQAGMEVRKRHAAYLSSLFAAERAGALADAPEKRRQDYRLRVDDVRSAIGWCLSKQGESQLGIGLIIDSAPMWLALSVLNEYVSIVDEAADRLWQDASIDPRHAIWLAPSLYLAKFHVAGISPSMAPMLLKARQAAELQGDVACQLTCLWGLLGERLTEARYDESLDFAQRFSALAPSQPDPMHLAMSQRVIGLCTWRNGDFIGARHFVDSALVPVGASPKSPVNQSLFYKQNVAACASASNLYWLTGHADQAVELAADAVATGLEHDVLGLCYGLAQAIVPLSFWIGNIDQAREHTMLLIDLASNNGLGFWLQWGRSYECALQRLSSTQDLRPDFIHANAASLGDLHTHILATILGYCPVPGKAIATSPIHWCTAELLRIAALDRLKSGDDPGAEQMLVEALKFAKRQGAIAWELRIAATLAEFQVAKGKSRAACDLLEPILERLTEGRETRDVRHAVGLMEKIAAA